MPKVGLNLQDSFLNQAKKEKIGVVIYLVNGVQLKGMVRGFDNFTVFLENEGKLQLVYKHAITTVSPQRPFSVNILDEAWQQQQAAHSALELASKE
jgi:host factor-I protein